MNFILKDVLFEYPKWVVLDDDTNEKPDELL